MLHPFPLPTPLPTPLEPVDAYWRSLLRGAAAIPFWDDVRLGDLRGLEDRIFMLDAFERPQRFRFAVVGEALSSGRFDDAFVDAIAPQAPFQFLGAQASATVEAAAPTLWAQDGYQRIVLPLWGEGRIGMLMGAVV